MIDYQKLYITMYNASTAALAEMGKLNLGKAKDILQAAQRETEKSCLAAGEVPAPPLKAPAQ